MPSDIQYHLGSGWNICTMMDAQAASLSYAVLAADWARQNTKIENPEWLTALNLNSSIHIDQNRWVKQSTLLTLLLFCGSFQIIWYLLYLIHAGNCICNLLIMEKSIVLRYLLLQKLALLALSSEIQPVHNNYWALFMSKGFRKDPGIQGRTRQPRLQAWSFFHYHWRNRTNTQAHFKNDRNG